MQPLDITPPRRETARGRESAWMASGAGIPPAEQFAAVINRALDGVRQETFADSEPVETLPRGRNRPDPAPPPASADSIHPDPSLGPDSVAASISPPPARIAESSCETGGRQPETTSSAAALDSGCLAGELSRLAPSSDAKTQSAEPGQDLPGNDVMGAGPNAGADPTVGGERVADPGGVRAALMATSADPAEAAQKTGPDPPLQPGSPAASGAGGISSAQQQVPMQKAEKTNGLSASAEQNLPVPPAGHAGEDLPASLRRSATFLPHLRDSESSPSRGSQMSDAAPAHAASSLDESSPLTSMSPVRSLERVHDLMSLHAFRLRDSGADSLQVVIKPGPGLQLSLNLKLQDGHVEMRATLDRGDFDFLSRHWAELQQQLEQRGVRLAPLNGGETPAGGDPPLFQQPGHRQGEEDAAPAGALAELALTGGAQLASTTKTRTLRGWESWA
jgi:hypothetical protein